MDIATSRELQNLKLATKLYLSLTGGPSLELCQYLLKIIDFFDTPAEGQVALLAEVNTLASKILLSIAQGVQERYPNPRLEHSLSWTQDKLESPDAFMVLHHDVQLALTAQDEPRCLP